MTPPSRLMSYPGEGKVGLAPKRPDLLIRRPTKSVFTPWFLTGFLSIKMCTHKLSPREDQIVELCMEGLTNDGIAHRLGLSVGTVNTYWLRIKLKVGGNGRTDTVVKIVKERAEAALREANVERQDLCNLIDKQANTDLRLRAAQALLSLAMEQIHSTVWATDANLKIHTIANGKFPSTHNGVVWDVGKTVYDIFKTHDAKDLAISAHLAALMGQETEVRLRGEFANMLLHVAPILNETHEPVGCISVLNEARN